jgi:adenosylcobinamide kinase / adenosylcobinamide-phosphate guanylyltransferase
VFPIERPESSASRLGQTGAVITLVLGGTRSGKSEHAERLALESGLPVTYLATAPASDDPDFAARVQRHQARRPAHWRTIDTGADLAAALLGTEGLVLVDSLGTWVAAHSDFDIEPAVLQRALVVRGGDSIVVSEEVGLSIHPPTEVGRRFVDALGEVNRAVADVADRVMLVVAGRVLDLP